MATKLLFLAGSTSKESVNKQLAKAAMTLAEAKGADVTFVDLKDYEMPIYCEDYESEKGIPENAKKLKQVFMDHDGFFIACPEYNSGYTPVLKNAIDWMSRPMGDDVPGLAGFTGKVGAIGSASPGGLGGMRVLVQLRMLLGNINVHMIPQQIAVGDAYNAFNDDGSLAKDNQASMLEGVISQFVETAASLSAQNQTKAA
ncbi:MAG: NAD(P)H-dependent oxidoreductase [Pseudomonadota bacterium]